MIGHGRRRSTDGRRARARAWRAAAATIATAGLGLLATGCGATSGPLSSEASTHGNGALARAIAYADCLRVNGVPSWPDPNSSGVFDKSQLTLQQLGVSSARLQAAQSACRHLLPNRGQPLNQAQLQQIRAQALRFSECVRAHGVPNFPDPGSDGRIPDPATGGIDQGSPTFEAANQACGKYRPPYMPSNAAYNAYARTHGG